MIGRVLLVALLLAPLSAGAVGLRGTRHRSWHHHRFNPRAMHRVARRGMPRWVAIPDLPRRERRSHFNPEGLPGVGPALHGYRQAASGWRHAFAP